MREPYGKLLRVAADLATGAGLNDIFALCERQKTVSTSVLHRMLDRAHDKNKEHAIDIRHAADALNKP